MDVHVALPHSAKEEGGTFIKDMAQRVESKTFDFNFFSSDEKQYQIEETVRAGDERCLMSARISSWLAAHFCQEAHKTHPSI